MKIIYSGGKTSLGEFRKVSEVTSIDYKNPDLIKLQSKIKKLAETHDVFFVWENVYDIDFIKSLRGKIYTVFYCTDDASGADSRSKPFVASYDHAFSGAINFDKDTTMIKKYLEWGANRADLFLNGIYEGYYDHNLTEEDIVKKERKIDLAHVGNPQNKTKRLLDIYKAFPQFAIYGKTFGFKGLLRTYSHILKRKKGWYEGLNPLDRHLIKLFLRTKPVSQEAVISLYKNSKIGLNMHLIYGPVNLRTWEMPANGVMQICDCKEGLKKIFKLGKEVVSYETIKEAIELIKYYFEHDEERKKIALAGWKRCMKDYKRIDMVKLAIEKIKQGMLDKGIEKFKDGDEIKVDKKILMRHRVD